jgi:hypothetical protein
MRTTRFFQSLTLTTFGLALYNTNHGIKARQLKQELDKEKLINSALQKKYESLLE